MATSLTTYGEKVALGEERRDMVTCGGQRILSIGLFDGIGCLRVALDLLGCDVIGHICVEKDIAGRRVVEHHFPDGWHYEDVVEIKEEDVQKWALRYGQASLILIGGHRARASRGSTVSARGPCETSGHRSSFM